MDYKGYQTYLALNNRKKSTIRRHLETLKRLEKQKIDFSPNRINEYIAKLKLEGKKNSYINDVINCVRVYIRFKNLSGFNIKILKPNPTVKAIFSNEEIEAFLNIPLQKGWHKKRFELWHIFWHCVAYSGARLGEIAHLEVVTVDFGRNVFIFQDTKTNEPREVPIASNVQPLLKEYINKLNQPYLFPSGRGGLNRTYEKPVIDDGDWCEDFHKRLKILGIKRPYLTPYSFRHSMATSLLSEGASLFHVKKLLGHKNLTTTEIYSHLVTKDIAEALSKHPNIRYNSEPKIILQSLTDLIKSFHIENDNRFKYKLEETEESIKFETFIVQ